MKPLTHLATRSLPFTRSSISKVRRRDGSVMGGSSSGLSGGAHECDRGTTKPAPLAQWLPHQPFAPLAEAPWSVRARRAVP